jgi:hypothetical protein
VFRRARALGGTGNRLIWINVAGRHRIAVFGTARPRTVPIAWGAAGFVGGGGCRELSNANVLTVAFRAFLSGHDIWLRLRERQMPIAMQTEFGMSADHHAGQGAVRGPEGMPITLDDLPPPGTKRWVIRRKAEVVAGVRAGLLSLEEACQRYTLSVEEFLSWQRLIDRHGLRGLRVTRLQDYRGNERPASEAT